MIHDYKPLPPPPPILMNSYSQTWKSRWFQITLMSIGRWGRALDSVVVSESHWNFQLSNVKGAVQIFVLIEVHSCINLFVISPQTAESDSSIIVSVTSSLHVWGQVLVECYHDKLSYKLKQKSVLLLHPFAQKMYTKLLQYSQISLLVKFWVFFWFWFWFYFRFWSILGWVLHWSWFWTWASDFGSGFGSRFGADFGSSFGADFGFGSGFVSDFMGYSNPETHLLCSNQLQWNIELIEIIYFIFIFFPYSIFYFLFLFKAIQYLRAMLGISCTVDV